MGFMRKAAIISTGGAARVAINPNSKKARTAKATEKMLKLQQAEAQRAREEANAAAQAAAQAQRAEFMERNHGRSPEQVAYAKSLTDRAAIVDHIERAASVNPKLGAKDKALIVALRTELLPGEEVKVLVVAWDVIATTRLKRDKGILVLTSERLLFRTQKAKHCVTLDRKSIAEGNLNLSTFSSSTGPEVWLTDATGKLAERFMLQSEIHAWFDIFYFLHPDHVQKDLAPIEDEAGSGEPSAAHAGSDALDQLTKLGELYAAGVLTDDEFAEQKARLLERM